MGQDYSSKAYRKIYDGDYVNTYQSYSSNKVLYEEHKKAYEAVSKKIESSPYNKIEKGKDKRVGASSFVDTLNIPKEEEKTEKTKEHKKRIVNTVQKQSGGCISVATEMPPPYKPQSETVKNTDYSKININALVHPIVYVGGGLYRNIYTDQTIDDKEARRILEYAGYKPKTQNGLGMSFVFIIVIALIIKWGGPILLILWGLISRSKNTTNYVNSIGNNNLIFQMPATDNEKQTRTRRANIYIYAGLIFGIIQLVTYYL